MKMGKIRGTELAKRVIKKVGNEKIVYREISALCRIRRNREKNS